MIIERIEPYLLH